MIIENIDFLKKDFTRTMNQALSAPEKQDIDSKTNDVLAGRQTSNCKD